MKIRTFLFCLTAIVPSCLFGQQDSIQFDTVPVAEYVVSDYTALINQLDQQTQQYREAQQKTIQEIGLIFKSHGIKPEEFVGWTDDKKSILKRRK